jgi:hypothetical protein
MGRPLNKKFFGDGAGLIACSSDVDASGAEACFIVSQRSNTKYLVQTEATFASNSLVVGTQYIIVTVGSGTWADAGASSEAVGTVFTATATTNGQADGTADAQRVCTLVATAPNPGELRIDVQPENAQTPLTAQIAFTSNGGTGVLETVAIDNPAAHYGYHANGTAVGIDGTVDGTVDFTVANGKIVSIVINSAGTTNTQAESPNPLSQAAAANPPLQFARIINARTVKTIEGNIYLWPIVGSDDGAGPSGRTEADLGEQ